MSIWANLIQALNCDSLMLMLPVLLSIGKIPVSSVGVFLALGFLLGVFLIWRLARAWDLDEEKVLDLTLITFLGGLIGARIYFVLENLSLFASNLSSIILFNKMPGFSFWGAFLGGWLTLFFFSRKRKIDFLQIADIASVGFIAGLIMSNLGCFLGGCSLGVQSHLFFAVNMVGQVGRRFPVQFLEGFLLLMVLLKLWSLTTHFHQRGKILSMSLIYIGVIKLITEPFKQTHDEGIYLSLVFIVLGLNIFYRVTKRSLKNDLGGFLKFFTDSRVRRYTLAEIGKYWYNQKTSISWKIRNFKKGLKKANVRVSYKNN